MPGKDVTSIQVSIPLRDELRKLKADLGFITYEKLLSRLIVIYREWSTREV